VIFSSADIRVIEHALDNGRYNEDYCVTEILSESTTFHHVKPIPCAPLPRQFGFWFHIGPGFAPLESSTYHHNLLSADNVKLLGQDGIPVFRNGWVDSTSLNYCREDLPGCQFQRTEDRLRIAVSDRVLRGKYFLGFNAGYSNYAHWLTDQLPLLWHYRQAYMDKDVGLLLPRDLPTFAQNYIAMIGIPKSAVTLIGDEVVDIDTLLFGTAFSFDAIPNSVVNLLKSFRESLTLTDLPRRKGIYISRRDTTIRTLLNEKAVCALMQQAGFDIIVPGEMSVQAQIDAFYRADIVIGCHGAGMANIIYCKPGTRVLELFPEYTVSAHFWMLASYFDLRYGAIFGTSFDQDRAFEDQAGSWDAPFVVQEDALIEYLRAADDGDPL